MTKTESTAPIFRARQRVRTQKDAESPLKQISGRRTQELVIALCGPLGSGVSTVSKHLSKKLTACGYEIKKVKFSELIQQKATGITATELARLSYSDRIEKLQKKGSELRETYGNDILAQLAIMEIAADRTKYSLNPEDDELDQTPIQLKRESRRVATILDSLKHPQEVELLQKVYGNMFYLTGVLSSSERRKHRLMTNKKMTDEAASALMERDKSEGTSHGQQLLKTLLYADFFIRNEKNNTNSLTAPIDRYVNLVLHKKDITPTRHEFAMFLAESAAKRSGCLSRQVGAAIISEDGDIIATGCNDVPKSGGGLYSTEDGNNDNRCFNCYDNACHNDKYKKHLSEDLRPILEDSIPENKALNAEELKIVIDKISAHPRIKNLLEFSRSVHAEMDAIISVARRGKHSLKGASLYTTTFPCHHCARHIVAAGIAKVFFIEPYEKSLALAFHEDSIVFEPASEDDPSDKVKFMHFEGVAPTKYLSLFASGERKDNGKLMEEDLRVSSPAIEQFLDTYIEYEAKVVKYVESKMP